MEMSKTQQELNDKLLELKQLQKLNKRQHGDADHAGEHLKRVIAHLEKENNDLKVWFCAFYILLYECIIVTVKLTATMLDP